MQDLNSDADHVKACCRVGNKFIREAEDMDAKLIKKAIGSSMNRILSGDKKPELEMKAQHCAGISCSRFKSMGSSCPESACRLK